MFFDDTNKETLNELILEREIVQEQLQFFCSFIQYFT